MNASYRFLVLSFLFLLSFLGIATQELKAQMTVDYTVTTFPTTLSNITSAGGQTAIGMQGGCPNLPCCSTKVIKVVLPFDALLRVEMVNFTPLAGSLIAYRSTVTNPTAFTELEFIASTVGNFCGFRDTLQLGRGTLGWDNVPYGQTPGPSSFTAIYDFNAPSTQVGFFPAGDYYIMMFNENQQAGNLGGGSIVDITFEVAQACESLTVPAAVDYDTLEVNSGSQTIGFYIKNERQEDVIIDVNSGINITGTHAADFTVVTIPDSNLAVGDSTLVQIQFAPTGGGSRTAEIEFNFADTNCSASSTATLSGTGGESSISVFGNGISINQNDTFPSSNDGTDFGSTVFNAGSISKTFYIVNGGSDTLDLTGNPVVNLVGSSQFTLGGTPASTLLPGDSTSFSVTFTPTVAGFDTADLFITNTSATDTFRFRIRGLGSGLNGLDFDGSGDYVNIDDVAADMVGVVTFTVESWVKVDPAQSGNDMLFAVNTSSDGSRMFIKMDDGVWEFDIGTSSDQMNGPDIRDDVWHHVAFTFDNGTVNYYLDGVFMDSETNSNPSFNSSDQWSIGQEWDAGGASDFFNGGIDELRLWKSVRSANEISGGRFCELSGSDPNLVAYYTFNQGLPGIDNSAFSALFDNSGNGHDGDLNGFALSGTASNFIAGSGVGAGCNSFSVSVCDAATYTAPSGAIFDSTGVYTDTVNTGSGDSALVINLTISFNAFTQDILMDTTVCDTIKEVAQTDLAPFARFENTESKWVEINGSVDSLVNTNRSIFLWMREADQISSSQDVLVGINTSGSSTVSNFGIATNEQLWINDGGSNRNSGVVVTDGIWHFVGYTYDEGSNLTQFWVDGVAAASFSNGQSISSTSRISIGQEFDSSTPSNFYDGDLTEVSIWNEVLDSADIALIMQSSIQSSHPKYSNLKAYYPMVSECGSDGFTVEDVGPHGYDGVASANDILVTDTLAALPSFNAAPLYNKTWTALGSTVSTADTLMLTSSVQAGAYSLDLSLDYFNISDSWNVTLQPSCSGPLAAIALDSNVSCNGFLNGGATASATGGTAPYTYAWSNTATSASIAGVAAGTYSVTITDDNGATDSTSITITEPALLLAATVVDSNISCNSFLDGGATASATGGTMPYSYQWSNSATTASITGVAGGTYTVTITDANGCTDSTIAIITEPAVLVAAITLDSNDSGNGGGATASATGGTMAYTYAWSNSATTAAITGLSAGTYSVTITDANGCTDSTSIAITAGPTLSMVLDSNISCNGVLDGGATASVIGGTMPYTYAWSNSATAASITGVGPGTYVVTITDASALFVIDSVTITEPTALSIDSISINNVSCFGQANGSAFANVTGGTGSYNYAWSNGATSPFVGILSPGTYTITVTDANGCTDLSSAMVIEPDSISLTVTSGTDSIDLTLSGGTTPYTFLWSNGATTEDLNNLSSGTYTVTITDANACAKVFTQEVVNPAEFFITTWKTDNPGGTGSTSIRIPAFTPTYSYNYDVDWDGDGTFDEFGITSSVTHDYGTAGTYTVQIKGQFPSLYFNPNGPSDDNHKLLSVDQWGAIAWETMEFAFYDCDSFNITATDTPNFSGVTSMEHMFELTFSFNSDIGYWDVSNVDDMSNMFRQTPSFNQDIGSWDVGNVTNMQSMFTGAFVFNQDIGSWDVGNVTRMDFMFNNADSFNQNINTWDVGSVTTMRSMFSSTNAFNSPLSNWEVDSVTTMQSMFLGAFVFNQDISGWDVGAVENMERTFAITDSFNQDLSTWDVSSATTMKAMFSEAEVFNQDISSWNTALVTDMSSMFEQANDFDQDIGSWDVSSVTTMSRMFFGADDFNKDIGSWDVDTVTNMSRMFASTDFFNQDLNSWDVSAVTDMSFMFNDAEIFNGDITGWDVSAVTNMQAMFSVADSFNQDISNWDVSSVTNMGFMFYLDKVFNQDISGWDVSSVTNMQATFRDADAFDQNLGSWDVDSVTNMTDMFRNAELSIPNYDSLLIGWAAQPLQSNINFHGGDSKYCAGEAARQSMITNFTWTFTDDGKSCPPTVNIVASDISCNGLTDGTATASAVDGQSPYTFLWSTGATTDSISGLSPGTYAVTVTDNLGETDTASVTIIEPVMLISASVVDSNVSCNGFLNGGATASATGGTMPYTYNWSNTATTASITGVGAGTYSVTITDANGCTDSTSATIIEPTLLVASTVQDSSATCVTCADGGATASATGGTMPYTYTWSNSATTAAITGVLAGTYSVTITDANGCTDSASVVIQAGPLAMITIDSTVSCNGLSDGGATASSSAGTAPFTYVWDASTGSATTATVTGLAAGTYRVTITDNNGLSDSTSVVITEPAVLVSATVVDSNASCNSFSTGGATASATGGTSPYTYAWSNAASAASINGLAAGTYSVTITDANGCTDSTAVVISEPDSIVFTLTNTFDASCNSIANGAFSYFITGGSPGIMGVDTLYSVISSFGPGEAMSRDTVDGIGAGSYFAVFSDSIGCLSDTNYITIGEPDSLIVSTAVDSNASCNGFADGAATASSVGGTAPYSYDWSNGDTTASATGLAAGTYSVTVTDANGCSDSTSVTITEPTVLAVAITLDSNESCSGFADGGLSAMASGGTSGYTYQWSNSTSTAANSGIGAGTYTVTATDANGCTATASDSIVVEDVTAPTVITQDITVYVDATGNTTITPAMVDNGSFDACGIASTTLDSTQFDCAEIGANTVILTVTDVNGNADTASAVVTVLDTTGPVMATQDITIYLDANGQASITPAMVDNGTADNCMLDSLALDSTDFDCSEVGANTMVLSGVDIYGNSNSATATVTVLDTVLPVVVTQNVTIYLDSNGMASIDTNDIDNGSSDACGIASRALDSLNFDCGEVGANTVTLTVTDVNGNVNTATATVTALDTIAPTLTVSNDIEVCATDASGTIVTYSNSSSDNCATDTITQLSGLASGSLYPIGTTTNVFQATDVNGNITIDSFTVEVYDFPVLSIDAVGDICETANPVNLTASPTGGVFSGPGVSGSSFDPTQVSVGNQDITYTFTTTEGCVYSTTGYAEVRANPIVTLGSFPDSLCYEFEIVACPVGTPSGGVYSGTGIDSILFLTQVAGIGQHTVTYTFMDAFGCVGADSTIADVIYCIDPLGIADAKPEPSLNVFPNPNRGTFTLTHDYSEPVEVLVFSMDGSLVRHLSDVSSREEITMEHGTQGVFFVRLVGQDIQETKRIIIQ